MVWRSSGMAVACLAALAGAPALAQSTPATSPEAALDPSSPLAPLPDLGVDWPELPPASAATADAATDAITRYDYRIEGIDAVATPLLRQRFKELSTLANAAQLDRRAREDADLLTTLLRGEGYYDAGVTTRVEPGERATVVLAARPGERYTFAGVTLAGVDTAGAKAPGLREAFGVKPGDPVDADAVAAGQTALSTRLGAEGFAFAEVTPPELVVDRAAKTATLEATVAPGGERRFGTITANPDNRVFDARHVAEIARWRPGDPYRAAELDDLRRALIQTGLASVADVKPVDAGPGLVDVAVKLEPAPPRTIAGELGYDTGQGARAEVSWTHRNLFPPEGALTVRGILGTQEQSAAVIFRRNNFHARDRVLTAQVAVGHSEFDAYTADTATIAASLERQTNIFFQKTWTWSLGAEFVATDEQDVIAATGVSRRRTYYVAALPTSLVYDGSDDLLNPTRGFRLGGRVSPELSLLGQAFGYARVQFDASAYLPATSKLVVAGRVRFGTILGAPRDAIAPSRRFYAGGGASVRGYGYQSIGPRDPDNDPIGGRSLTEFALEARVRMFGNFGVVPFLDAGNISTGVTPPLSGLRFGTGLGVRYYSNFGPIRLDVGTPLNPQPGDARVAVYVSLGQAF
jgi:translocation and assembly module TamA